MGVIPKSSSNNFLKKRINIYAATVIVIFFTLVMIIIASIIYTNLTRPKADYQGFASMMRPYVKSNTDIYELKRTDRDMFRVTVKEAWYGSSEIEKIRFCKNIHDTVWVYARQYKLIYGDMANVYLSFYDMSGIEVAEQTLTDYKILH